LIIIDTVIVALLCLYLIVTAITFCARQQRSSKSSSSLAFMPPVYKFSLESIEVSMSMAGFITARMPPRFSFLSL
jgi:hypothetical protein